MDDLIPKCNIECILSNTDPHNLHSPKGLGYDVDALHNTNWLFSGRLNFLKSRKDQISESDTCASTSAGKS